MSEKTPHIIPDESSNYVRKEVIFEKNSHDLWAKNEWLVVFRHNIQRLNSVLQRLNQISDNKNIPNIEKALNEVLAKKGFGGENGGNTHQAYFHREGTSLLLIINTLIDGKPNSSIGDINTLLWEIDKVLPSSEKIQENLVHENIQSSFRGYSTLLSRYENSLSKVNREYGEKYNTLSAGLWLLGLDSEKNTHQRSMEDIQSKWATEYKKFLDYYQGKDLSPQEQKMFSFQKARFEELLARKLENPELFIEYIADHKMQAVKYGWEGAKWTAEGIKDALLGSIELLYAFTTEPEVRDAVMKSGGEAGRYIKENCTEPKKVWDDFTRLFAKEMEKIRWLPAEEQAKLIGKITGNIIGTLMGAKAGKSFFHSNTLRIKYKAPKIGEGWVSIARKKISDAKTWNELYESVEQIDHIRFREGWNADVLREIIKDVEKGKRKVSDLPLSGGLRKKVQKLKEFWGEIPEEIGLRGVKNRVIKTGKEKTGRVMEKWAELFKEALPEVTKELEQVSSFLKNKIGTGHDFIDIKIAHLRSKIEYSLTSIKKWISSTEICQELLFLGKISKGLLSDIKTATFKEKDQLAKSINSLNKRIKDTLNKMNPSKNEREAHEIKNNPVKAGNIPEEIFTPQRKISKESVKKLWFSEGIATEEIIKKNGEKVYLYRNRDWELLIKGRNADVTRNIFVEASNFSNGQAIVRKAGGKFGVIDKQWSWVINPRYDTLHDIGNARKVGSVGDKHFLLEYKNGTWKEGEDIFDFMTEPRGKMVIAVKKTPGGEEKFIIGDSGKPKKVEFSFVDDFNESGYAAALKKSESGQESWHIINRSGNEIPWIEAKSNLEALHQLELKNADSKVSMKVLKKQAEELLLDSGITEFRVQSSSTNGVFLVYGKQQKGQSSGLMGMVDINTGHIIKPEYEHIHISDAQHGFFRVKKDGKWGLIEDGKMKIETKYDSINIRDERLHLMDVELNGKIGLVDKDGKVLIPLEFTKITSLREGVYQWVVHDNNYKVVSKGAIVDASQSRASHLTTTGDTIGMVIGSLGAVNIVRKVESRWLDALRNGTNELIQSLKKTKLQWFMNGFSENNGSLSIWFSRLLRDIPFLTSTKAIRTEVYKCVENEVNTYVRNYIQKNHISKLSVKELQSIADFKKNMENDFMTALERKVLDNESWTRSLNTKYGDPEKIDHTMEIYMNNLNQIAYIELLGNKKNIVKQTYEP